VTWESVHNSKPGTGSTYHSEMGTQGPRNRVPSAQGLERINSYCSNELTALLNRKLLNASHQQCTYVSKHSATSRDVHLAGQSFSTYHTALSHIPTECNGLTKYSALTWEHLH
jgi:hypothetical protein